MIYINKEVDMRRRRKKQSFAPDRQYIQRSVENYLKEGGAVTKIVVDADTPMKQGYQSYYFALDGEFDNIREML
jgi:hypothetical protein